MRAGFRGAWSGALLLGLPLLIAGSGGCYGTAQVRQVFMALDANGDRVRDTFYTDSTAIICNVLYAGSDPDTTMVANFVQTSGEPNLFDGSNNVGPASRVWASIEIAPSEGDSIQSFQLDPPTPVSGGARFPYPVGSWKCIITVNGQNAGESDFKVVYPTPDCPESGVASQGQNCTAYQANASCPNSDNTAASCTCVNAPPGNTDQGLRVWSCQ